MYGHSVVTLVLLTALGGATPSCKSNERPPPYSVEGGQGGTDTGINVSTGGTLEPSTAPPEDTTGLCGNQILPVLTDRPNLYLVLDRSGSMTESMVENPTSSDPTKYEASVRAIHDVLFAIGHRVAYGAAVFPSLGNVEDCSAGSSIDRVKAGDSVTYARNDLDGPHLTALLRSLTTYRPEGGTPTSATLERLVPLLLELEGKTSVILTTDGAPNCNAEAVCDAANCTANLEGAYQINGKRCDANVNCCAATGDYGPYACIDTDATVAPLAELLAHDIKTYVIGLPGTEAYQTTMNRLAVAGGTAREQTTETDPQYYRVQDSKALVTALKAIATELTISCTLTLDAAPPDWAMVNVYFDNGLVRFDAQDGWKQLDGQTLELVGSSCEQLRSGDVFQVQVVAGCKTEVMQ